MAKAINWPSGFRQEILAEDSVQPRIALRLGELYYEHRYWTPDEVVDIRANHLKIRQGVILSDLRQCAIRDLSEADLRMLKRSLQSQEAVMRFLSETYGQPVDPETRITVVTYRNLPVEPAAVESDASAESAEDLADNRI